MIAQVIIDINTKRLDRYFDYIVPKSLEEKIEVGMQVLFKFGNYKELKKGYVMKLKEKSEYDESKLKYLDSIVDRCISFEAKSLIIAEFIKETYGSTLMQALKITLPVKKATVRGKILDIMDNNIPSGESDIILADEQKYIVDEVLKDIYNREVNKYLIHGITGSGKTQVFIEIIKKVIKNGKKAIVLIPEISLTFQTVRRFIDNFGSRVGVIHSKLTQAQKYTQIEKAKNNEIDVIIGPRSALFTLFDDIGIIIIDEEHEDSYKSEQAPRYDARVVADFMSDKFKIPLILASATPSVDTYYKVINGDYRLFELSSRRSGAKLPLVEIVDMRQELKDGNLGIFSKKLINYMYMALEKKEQIILFINRRGYSNFISCMSCGKVFTCEHCDVTYKYHRDTNKLKCHYCGSEVGLPNECPECGSSMFDKVGIGTQKVEDDIKKLFPNTKVLRMDTDTTARKGTQEKILEKFHKRKADILIGTQMIIKGHDFNNVSVVGVINVDTSLNMNTYRASEKTYQTLVQASGRAGRNDKEAVAVFQTYSPDNKTILCAAKNNYKDFLRNELKYRKEGQYTPFVTMLKITISCKNEEKLDAMTFRIEQYIEKLRKEKMEILGPSNELIYKLKDEFRKTLYIKANDKVIKYFISVIDYVVQKDSTLMYANVRYEINPIF